MLSIALAVSSPLQVDSHIVPTQDPAGYAGPDNDTIEYAVLRCPKCGQRSREPMPRSACLYFYSCPRCSALLKPKPGDCCVFCSYGDRVCPPVSDQLPGQERTVCTAPVGDGIAEVRVVHNELSGWTVELFLNGRFLAAQRCASEDEALGVAREMQHSWSNRA